LGLENKFHLKGKR